MALTKKDPEVHDKLVELVEKYAHVEKRPEPHVCLGDWWTLYDYGFDEVRTWPKDFVKEFPRIDFASGETRARIQGAPTGETRGD